MPTTKQPAKRLIKTSAKATSKRKPVVKAITKKPAVKATAQKAASKSKYRSLSTEERSNFVLTAAFTAVTILFFILVIQKY